MSSITLSFKTDNAAFRFADDLDKAAVLEFMRKAMQRLNDRDIAPGDTTEFLLRDMNGNQVGSLIVEEDMP